MAIEIRTVQGVTISTLRKIGLYVFGKAKYVDIIQRGAEVKMYVDESTGNDEVARFEAYWGIKIIKIKA